MHYYPRALCPFCLSDKVSWQEAKGTGTIYTYSVTRRGGPVPYCIAYVKLDEGVSMMTNIVDCDLDTVRCDQKVKVVFKKSEGGVSIPMFTPPDGAVWVPVAIPPQAPVEEGFVEVPGSRLWYWDTGGTGHPVILLHAGTQSAAGWVYQQPVLAHTGYRVIAYSRRGYYRSDSGDSDNPGIGSEDLHCLIRHLKLGAVDFRAPRRRVFHVDYAPEYPEKVRSLVIVSSYLNHRC